MLEGPARQLGPGGERSHNGFSTSSHRKSTEAHTCINSPSMNQSRNASFPFFIYFAKLLVLLALLPAPWTHSGARCAAWFLTIKSPAMVWSPLQTAQEYKISCPILSLGHFFANREDSTSSDFQHVILVNLPPMLMTRTFSTISLEPLTQPYHQIRKASPRCSHQHWSRNTCDVGRKRLCFSWESIIMCTPIRL